ncbi:hypothetical protein [Sulfolobus spindle-shaped virus 6]|uniref:Uncharacterized protein n=1 Tax=Sulfolobus spindle-shaped virus 6 TaxID=693627 RepID=D1GF46_9VIRU|nr:hypothetical protein SSSV6_gp28 [Sulfolobus spindle-shaped virus 6]ACZ35747.1 hypothetical protein [Sulfolobus spindle-shaped virus 6]
MGVRFSYRLNFHGNRVEIYGTCRLSSIRRCFSLLSKFLWSYTLLHHLHFRFHSCGNWSKSNNKAIWWR